MESRTRMAIGGMATVAASVTVICVVALTNSLSLADSAGSPIGAPPVVVPVSGGSTPSASPTPAATPRATPSPSTAPVEPVSEATSDPETTPPSAEVVPAPEARIVTPAAPTAEPEPRPDPEPAVPSTLKDALAQVRSTGSWDPLRAWAESRGWSDERLDRLIEELERVQDGSWSDSDSDPDSAGDRRSADAEGSISSIGGSEAWRGQGGSSKSDERRWSGTDSKKERSARAGTNVDDRSSGHGEKKDRWRDSPKWRDR